MATLTEDIEKIDDEDVLESMINKTEDLEIRRKIRKRQSAIREKRLAAYESQKQERLGKKEDAIGMRLRMAEEDKQRRLRDLEEQAAVKAATQKGHTSQGGLKDRLAQADEEKQRKLGQYKDVGKSMSTAYNVTTSDLLKDKDGGRETTVRMTKTVTQFGGAGGTTYGAPKTSTGGAGGAGAVGGGGGVARQTGVTRNPSAIKEMLLNWCKAQCNGYENVNITNFSGSWNDGMAFCALIHHFYPESFDFSKLNPKNRRGNFKLAFDLAEKLADIAPLLDVEDMVRMKNPDWKCVFTYVQSFYRRFAMQKPQGPSSPSSPPAVE